jgi:hypothetical protein
MFDFLKKLLTSSWFIPCLQILALMITMAG